MNEMLGNQYFMARNYPAAKIELEKGFALTPENKGIKRKLIVCNIMTNDLSKAYSLFHELVAEDVEFIIIADAVKDDCPCPEIIEEFDHNFNPQSEFDYNLIHGMLWLYCNPKKSLDYLRMAALRNSSQTILEDIAIIEEYLKITPNY